MISKVTKQIKKVKKNDPFLITITTLSSKKGKELDTFLFVNKFPAEELDGTKKMIAELIDKEKK